MINTRRRLATDIMRIVQSREKVCDKRTEVGHNYKAAPWAYHFA